MGCPSIVIVEDDQDIREAILDFLLAEGYSAKAYANGKAAIDDLTNCPEPCLILLDLMMPVMNGWEFLKARQALGDTIIAIPVFIVSAFQPPLPGASEGVVGFMKKPIDTDILLRIVRKHCGVAGRAA